MYYISRFFMKMFNTNNIEIVKCCQQEFCFYQVSLWLAAPKFFKGPLDSVKIFLSKESCACKLLYFVTLPANRRIYLNAHVYSSFGLHVRLDFCLPQVVC